MEQAATSFSVIIPAYNAAASLEELIDRLDKSAAGMRIIIVDDGSTDNTAEIAKSAGAEVLEHDENRGKGAALQTGFDFLKNISNIGFVFTIDADLQHQPEDILGFIQTQRQTKADIVIGWRKRIGTGMPVHRIVSNSLTSLLVGARIGKRIKDSQCGFRMIRHSVIKNIHLTSTGYEAETEFLIKAIKEGYKIEFVPIKTIYNKEKSHMTNWRTTITFIKVLMQDYT